MFKVYQRRASLATHQAVCEGFWMGIVLGPPTNRSACQMAGPILWHKFIWRPAGGTQPASQYVAAFDGHVEVISGFHYGCFVKLGGGMAVGLPQIVASFIFISTKLHSTQHMLNAGRLGGWAAGLRCGVLQVLPSIAPFSAAASSFGSTKSLGRRWQLMRFNWSALGLF